MARHTGEAANNIFYIAPHYGALCQTFKDKPTNFDPSLVKTYKTKEGVERYKVSYDSGIEGYWCGLDFEPVRELEGGKKIPAQLLMTLRDPVENETYIIQVSFSSRHAECILKALDRVNFALPVLVRAYDGLKTDSGREISGLYFAQRNGDEMVKIDISWPQAIQDIIPKTVAVTAFDGSVSYDKQQKLAWLYNFYLSRRQHIWKDKTWTMEQATILHERSGAKLAPGLGSQPTPATSNLPPPQVDPTQQSGTPPQQAGPPPVPPQQAGPPPVPPQQAGPPPVPPQQAGPPPVPPQQAGPPPVPPQQAQPSNVNVTTFTPTSAPPSFDQEAPTFQYIGDDMPPMAEANDDLPF